MVKLIGTLDEFEETLKTEKVAVDFTATWCPPCRLIGPKFEEMAADFPSITFVKVDVDDNSETAEKYGISAMPTFQFFKDGTKTDELVGADANQLREKLKMLQDN